MKNVKFFLGAVLCVLLLTACTPVSDCGQVAGTKDVFGKSTLSIGVAGITQSARTILPVDWTDERAGTLQYVLTGSRTLTDGVLGDNEIPTGNEVINYSQIKNGSAQIALEPAVWHLVLTAYQVNGENLDPVLVSPITDVNLSNGNASVEFFLKAWTGSTAATGDFNVTVKFPKPENFDHVVYGLYTSGAINAEPVSAELEVTKDADGEDDDDIAVVNAAQNLYSFALSADDITAGNYWFNMNFLDAAGNSIGFRAEKVIIDGGNISKKDITLQDFFERQVETADDFAVSYAYNSNGMLANSFTEDTIPDYYLATFSWSDISLNETGFELVIKDVTGETPVTVDLTADGVISNNSITNGLLAASSTSVTVKLDTGKVYDAQFRAKNRLSPAAIADDSETVSLSGINLYTVSYTLSGGRIMEESNPTAENVVKYVVPYNKSAEAFDLIGLNNTNTPYIYKQGYTTMKWFIGNTEVTEVAANNTENVAVTAYWPALASMLAHMPSYSSMSGSLISNKAEDSVTTVDGTASGASVTMTAISGLDEDTLEFTLYDQDYTTEITEGVVVENGTFTWTIGTAAAGRYRLEVTADKDGIGLSNTFWIYITR